MNLDVLDRLLVTTVVVPADAKSIDPRDQGTVGAVIGTIVDTLRRPIIAIRTEDEMTIAIAATITRTMNHVGVDRAGAVAAGALSAVVALDPCRLRLRKAVVVRGRVTAVRDVEAKLFLWYNMWSLCEALSRFRWACWRP